MTTPAQITSKLKAAGYIKAEWRRVGCSTRNEGFLTSQDSFKRVIVSWELEGNYRDLNTSEREYVDNKVAELASALSDQGINTRTIQSSNCNYLQII